MQMRPIEDLASFVRDLDSECTTLNINQNYLVAGSKLGRIKLWEINTGQVKWSLDVDGPFFRISAGRPADRHPWSKSCRLKVMCDFGVQQ